MKLQLFESGETLYLDPSKIVAVIGREDDDQSIGIMTVDGRAWRVRAAGTSAEHVAKLAGIDRMTPDRRFK